MEREIDVEDQFIEMVKLEKDDFYRLAYSYVKNQDNALDIVGEATYKALKSLNKLRNIEFIKTWFYRIVINESIRFLKKNKNIVLESEIIENIYYRDEGKDESIDLRIAIDKLPLKYRTVIILRYYKELEIKEIARILAANENTIKTRLKRATLKLKENLGGTKWKEN